VTKFFAPMVMVAFGWHAVAEIWAAAMVVMALIFYFTTSDDPVLVERRRKGEKPTSTLMELEPLKNVQVWRFSLYYFFVFGAFVALALWLPQYLIHVYGVDIRLAGIIAAFFSVPASLFRAYGGHLSDVYARAGSCTGPSRSRWSRPSFCPIRQRIMSSRAITARWPSMPKWA
jgi:NNP family nitrate/nitrite transporter-like MFS transporter